MTTENPVSGVIARAELGKPGPPMGSTRYSAIRHAMGLTGRYVFVSEIREFLRNNPNFAVRDVYKFKTDEAKDKKSHPRNPANAQNGSGRKSAKRSLKHV